MKNIPNKEIENDNKEERFTEKEYLIKEFLKFVEKIYPMLKKCWTNDDLSKPTKKIDSTQLQNCKHKITCNCGRSIKVHKFNIPEFEKHYQGYYQRSYFWKGKGNNKTTTLAHFNSDSEEFAENRTECPDCILEQESKLFLKKITSCK